MARSLEPRAGLAWLVCSLRHCTPSVVLDRALGPPASSPAAVAVEESIVLPRSSPAFHTVDLLVLLRMSGGADGRIHGAVEVLLAMMMIYFTKFTPACPPMIVILKFESSGEYQDL
jgi:hypothetical protein